MKFEEEIEKLLQTSLTSSDFAALAGTLSEEGNKGLGECFGVLQKQLRIQGQAILRLAAAIDGLGSDPS